MNPVPSPYNAATGGVRFSPGPPATERRDASEQPEAVKRTARVLSREEIATLARTVSETLNPHRPPLLPLWRIQYRLDESQGVAYIRAENIGALVAELRRLYTARIRYAVWQVEGEGATYGGTGAPAAYDTLDPVATPVRESPAHGDH